ncbi:MAG TPA: MTH1187 family thiamine-binding protein [Nitrososphaeraceae archaeon]|nr:MTH1187 family thiamine-binding protein [Nitrososphaeraceae archaeon]
MNDKMVITAEISIIPIRLNNKTTGMSKEIAAVYDAIKKIDDIKITLTGMGTQIETRNLERILKIIEISHKTLREIGVKRIISSIRIDERLDKSQTLNNKITSVKQKLKK